MVPTSRRRLRRPGAGRTIGAIADDEDLADRVRDLVAGEVARGVAYARSLPAKPFNLRIAYRAFGPLSDDWVREVQEGNELTVRALDGTFNDLLQNDMPMAADLVRDAEYFLLVIDEKAADEPPPPPGSEKTSKAAETRQALEHFARIGVWRITKGKASDKQIIRRRRTGKKR